MQQSHGLFAIAKLLVTSTVDAAADDDDDDDDDCFICLAVGYTIHTVYFGPMENAIDIAPDLQMPQSSLVDRKHHDCSTNYTSGIHLLVLLVLRRFHFES